MFRVPLRTISHRLAGLVAALLLALVGVAAAAVPASAAAGGLVVSDPGDREQKDDAPGAVTLVFEGKVGSELAKVLVLDSRGRNVTAGPLVVEGTNVATDLQTDLPKGTYTVHYRVNGSGGQPRGGAFQFSYGPGTFTDLPDKTWSGSAQEPEILRGDNPNGPDYTEPPGTASPGLDPPSGTSTSKATQKSEPTTTTATGSDDPTGEVTEAGEDPSRSAATGVPNEDGTGRVFLIGGIILLAAVAGTTFGVWRSRQKGSHS